MEIGKKNWPIDEDFFKRLEIRQIIILPKVPFGLLPTTRDQGGYRL